MKKVFIINAGQHFAHSKGEFNKALTGWTEELLRENNIAFRATDINNNFDPLAEAEHFKWADFIIFHTPIWWFQVPNRLKLYLDEVLTAGRNNGIYANDGRSHVNPSINYGKGGLMQGKRYMVTTSWNAPEAAFVLEGEFFGQTSVDDGVLYGFHKMMEFIGTERVPGFHFFDVMKNLTPERFESYKEAYNLHLSKILVI